MEFCFESFWDSMGVTTKVIDLLYGWRIWFGKTFIEYLESRSLIFDVDIVEGKKLPHF